MKIKMKKIVLPLFTLLLLAVGAGRAHAQDDGTGDSLRGSFFDELEFSGYIQSQYQYTNNPDTVELISFTAGKVRRFETDKFSLRRGRLKLKAVKGIGTGVVAIDANDHGLFLKDAYMQVYEPFLGTFGLRAGVFARPFGHEVGHSSALREVPERSRVVQTLFPGERDLGAMLIIQMPEASPLHFLRLEAGMVNGNGVNVESNRYKDALGRLSFHDPVKNSYVELSGGISFYAGKILHRGEVAVKESGDVLEQERKFIYEMGTVQDTSGNDIPGFVMADSLKTIQAGQAGLGVDRNYLGFDLQLKVKSNPLGNTTLRGEYFSGQQPAQVFTLKDIYQFNSFSPMGPQEAIYYPRFDDVQYFRPTFIKTTTRPHDTFVRDFSGGYFYIIQEIMQTGHSLVFRYDWYDPNTDVKGGEIVSPRKIENSAGLFSPADIKYWTYSIAANIKLSDNVKLMLAYDLVQNEKTELPSYVGDTYNGKLPDLGYESDVKDDVFTVRMQYQF